MNTTATRHELKTWKFTLDQTQYGLGAGWANPEYDDSRWIDVESYTSWETYEAGMFDYEGHGWFRTWVDVELTPPNSRSVLKFDGVGGVCQVYVNGKLAGTNDNRYLPFQINVTDFVKKGKNLVAVLVDNSHRGMEHLTGGQNIEWVLYGGLTHKIYLDEQPACYIEHVRADAEADGSLTVTAIVNNRNASRVSKNFVGDLTVSVKGLKGCAQTLPVELAKTEKVELVFNLQAKNVKTGSPDAPNLYELNVQLTKEGEDYYAVTEKIGFRTIETCGTKILLNGKEILLKGANRYDEFAPYGNCAPEEEIRKEFLEMKKAGLNLIRTHYPQDEIHYRLADELGLMYMIEVPLNWWNPKVTDTMADHFTLAAEAVDTLDRTFQNFCNHPCWTVWSVGNECGHSHPVCQELFRTLAARMRALKCRRLVTYAANKPLLDSKEMDFVDFLGMNYYSGVKSENVDDFPAQLHVILEKKMKVAQELYPNIPHVMTEFGYPCVYGIHGSETEGRYTEDFGTTFMKAKLPIFMSNKQMKGMIIWCWADYRHRRCFIPAKTGMGMQATYGPYGLVSIDRKPKKLFLGLMSDFYNNWKVEE